ncbi:MAG: efflux RND transporter periplasmic adaptor subunit [Bryobacterales bacterium]|nr:efflux RND transporter periplasmic adaptor subunit [Bryobacterales bacterium]
MNLSVIAAAALSGLVLALAGCQADTQLAAEQASPPRNPLAITPGEGLLRQVDVGEPRWTMVSGTLRVAGRVEADETRMARVSSPVTGRITELEVVEGQTVRRGELLAVIRSTELADAQFAYLKSLSQQQLASRAVERAQRLLDAGVIGEAEVQRRDAELVQASAELSAARDQLRVLGMPDEARQHLEETRTVNAVSQVLATIDGTVMERPVTLGQVVQPAETIMVLADLSHVWLVADVPEQTAGTLSVGKIVEADIAALPGEVITGKLSFVSAIVNPETRTVRARMDLPNREGKYKPAMLATMTLQDLAERRQVIPVTAIVRESNREHVFVQTAPGTFELRPVELGGEYGNLFVLIEGVRTGESIALDGAFHLNNERKRLALQGD